VSDGAARVSFRPLTEGDLALIHRWRNRAHVARWFHGPISQADVRSKYLPRISGQSPVRVLLIEHDRRAIGMIQHYRVGEVGDFPPGLVEPSAHTIDLFIGEDDLRGHGIGTAALDAFVSLLLARDDVASCVIDPDAANAVAIRSYGKVGFTPVGERRDARDGARRIVMERRR
jgi:aminoglycoside 6'-N-acetyltransferase